MKEILVEQSPTEDNRIADRKTSIIAEIVRRRLDQPVTKALVVGCGNGIEAAVIASELNSNVVGIDVRSNFDLAASRLVDLRVGDATALDFADGTFDFIYSYHALEHIPQHHKALQEMYRVLSKDGAFCIGTPNRLRLVGYLGSKHASSKEKLLWNLLDWKARAVGRFRNEYGAHAGFSASELSQMLREQLGDPENITMEYYLNLYSRRKSAIKLIEDLHLAGLILPSVYFFGHRCEHPHQTLKT